MRPAAAQKVIIQLARAGLGTVYDFKDRPHAELIWWLRGLNAVIKEENAQQAQNKKGS